MKQRLDYIDIAKGIGIILVVLSHTDYSDIMYYTLAFYVPIFFLCSGYTSSPKTTQIAFKENLKRHATKLIKPYFFYNFILILIFFFFYLQGIIGIFYSRYCLYPTEATEPYRFFINGNFPLWFLTCMIVSYLLFYILIYHPKQQYYFASGYLIITFLLSYLPILLPWSFDTAFYMALFMFSGMKLREIFPSIYESKRIPSLVVLSIVLYLLLIPFCDGINLSVRKYGSSIATCFIAGLSGCITTIYIANLLKNTLVGKILQQVGKHSLTIFCLEIPFIVLIGRPIANFLFENFNSQQIVSISTSIVETFIACVGGYCLSIILQSNRFYNKLLF